MKLTLLQAATQVGMSKVGLYKAIKKRYNFSRKKRSKGVGN
jgi:hypothetical protein